SDKEPDGSLLIYRPAAGVFRLNLAKTTIELVCPDVVTTGSLFALVGNDIAVWTQDGRPDVRFDRSSCESKTPFETVDVSTTPKPTYQTRKEGITISAPDAPASWGPIVFIAGDAGWLPQQAKDFWSFQWPPLIQSPSLSVVPFEARLKKPEYVD